MNTIAENTVAPRPVATRTKASTAFGLARDLLGNRFVYVVISSRARGLSVGVNLNPNRQCNFDCIYCEVDRHASLSDFEVDLNVMAAELESTVDLVNTNGLRFRPAYASLSPELLQLQHIALSGDGEPTLCPNFRAAVETVVHLRARGCVPFFKIVLITNASNLDAPEVQQGLRLFTGNDEIWAKLDAGTESHMQRVNVPGVPLQKVLSNIRSLAQRRPVVIQSVFPAINGCAPLAEEIEQYAQRLKELKDAGARIPLVQIRSATRPTPHSECGHLPLKTLSQIAHTVRRVSGLNAEIF